MKQTNFARITTKYFSDFLISQRNVSTNTIKSYRNTFRQLLTYMRDEKYIHLERLEFKDIRAQTVVEFLLWLEKNNQISISTRNQRLAAIHSFYRYAQAEYPDDLFEMQKILNIPFKKKPRPAISYLTKEEMKLLFDQPDVKNRRDRRNLALMAILYDTGARVQELIDLCVKDIRLHSPATVTLTGKGKKTRCVPIIGNTVNLVSRYMNDFNLKSNGRQQSSLFSNSRGQKFTRPGICYILNKYFNQAKKNYPEIMQSDRIHPHMIRHAKAVHMLESGINLIYIRDFLGHVSITTTEIYLKTETELKRSVLERNYPNVVTQDIPEWKEDTELLQWLNDFCR
ncbi:tyrosine-type recombinase/integrase [Herbivorax sp. ANBcel31]|uniref:tyrosine-type recombinase/integrase n=1 Tax=Herbivorax sp. ANBcel31 TaxID=3069754 RepID=UPI0027B706F0|nr:tyrosine-type recombinase/integrase [Herbivorax sp. ANBcel31]MDQ2086407.1 tyrosine-type recombinase/integrase [Herbivorax sp. ANBcel31]